MIFTMAWNWRRMVARARIFMARDKSVFSGRRKKLIPSYNDKEVGK